MRKRELLAKCSTPVCGARLEELECDDYDPSLCVFRCHRARDNKKQIEFFSEEELKEMEEQYNRSKK